MTIVRKSWSVLVTAALLGALPGAAFGETVFHKSTSYFPIRGTTAQELDRELASRGPLTKQTGSRHPGATRIRFSGDVTYAEQGGRCGVQKARVVLRTEIILPSWKNRKKAGKDLALVWDTLLSDIKRHEARHAEIARSHARTMEKALLSLAAQKSCDAMQARVAAVSADAIADHDRDQARFDRVEAANFDRRMQRLVRYRLGRL